MNFSVTFLRTWLEEDNIQFFKNLSVQMNMTVQYFKQDSILYVHGTEIYY